MKQQGWYLTCCCSFIMGLSVIINTSLFIGWRQYYNSQNFTHKQFNSMKNVVILIVQIVFSLSTAFPAWFVFNNFKRKMSYQRLYFSMAMILSDYSSTQLFVCKYKALGMTVNIICVYKAQGPTFGYHHLCEKYKHSCSLLQTHFRSVC